ncbi:unnamed protein product [Rhodiola kirilowii]
MRQELLRPYTREEIKKALFQMAPTKAPGIDGYPALFFPRHWNIVGDILCKDVLKFLNEGVLDERLNRTRVVIIPKKKGAQKAGGI